MGFALRGIKILSFIVIFIFIAAFVKYMYGQYTGEIITEDFVIEEKKVLKESSRRPDDQYVIITDDKRFKIDKDDYYNIEIGDRIYIKYNDKTLFVRDIENYEVANE